MKKELTALEAKYEAQKIAFGPLYFQAIMAMKELGLLELIGKSRKGITIEQLCASSEVSPYGIELLLEAAEVLNVVDKDVEGRFTITKIGFFLLKDQMTQVNLDYTRHVCYEGAHYMKESIVEGKPVGLKTLGDWPTLYEGLAQFPEPVKKAWFAFDHYYSDDAFPHALEILFKNSPKKMFDIGGNTGKWAMACCNYDSEVEVTLLDLPGQLAVAKENVEKAGFADRVNFYPIDLLNPDLKIPKGADTVWMSQFLDCFSKEQIVQILKNVHQAASDTTNVYIMEPFIDNQEFEAAKYSLVATSLYFTIMANGNSKMYSVEVMKALAEEAGFKIVETYPLIGDSYHTILQCQKM